MPMKIRTESSRAHPLARTFAFQADPEILTLDKHRDAQTRPVVYLRN